MLRQGTGPVASRSSRAQRTSKLTNAIERFHAMERLDAVAIGSGAVISGAPVRVSDRSAAAEFHCPSERFVKLVRLRAMVQSPAANSAQRTLDSIASGAMR